jgi:nicotinate phosphoribosyltransferase
VDGMPVEKRSSHKESHGGRKQALRMCKPTGTILEEVVYPRGRPPRDESGRDLTVELVRGGEPVGDLSIDAARRRVKEGLHSLPWDGLKLSRGEPAVPTRMIPSGG